MNMKKMLIGVASACLILGGSATVIYAGEDIDKASIEATIEVIEAGTMDTKVDGVEMEKEFIEDNMSFEIQELDEMEQNIEGKELLTQEIISE